MMSTLEPTVSVKSPKGIKEKIRSIYLNYMQLMIDCSKYETLKAQLMTSNEKRLFYLNEVVGMTIPEGVEVILEEKSNGPRIYIKAENGNIHIHEGSASLEIMEKLNNDETVKEKMRVATAEEVDVNLHQVFKNSNIVLKLPLIDPAQDLMLFELKYGDSEIVFTTCCVA
jgi:hypothetical protein